MTRLLAFLRGYIEGAADAGYAIHLAAAAFGVPEQNMRGRNLRNR